MKLKGKVAAITGGARGIGHSTAVKFAAAGKAGRMSRGIAASKIAKLLPWRMVQSGSRDAGRSLIPSRYSVKS